MAGWLRDRLFIAQQNKVNTVVEMCCLLHTRVAIDIPTSSLQTKPAAQAECLYGLGRGNSWHFNWKLVKCLLQISAPRDNHSVCV